MGDFFCPFILHHMPPSIQNDIFAWYMIGMQLLSDGQQYRVVHPSIPTTKATGGI